MAIRRLRDKLPDAFVMLAVVTLTGCVMIGEPRPVEVSLDRSDVTVRLSDNSRCTGPVQSVRGANGQVLVSGAGPLQNCSTPLSYRVTADAGLNPLRLVFEEVFGAIGLGNAIAPAAEVEITAPDGRTWVFASPPVARTARHPFPAIRSGQHLLRTQAAGSSV
jgi:hypothetical protein